MSFLPWCAAVSPTPVDDTGKKTFFGHFWTKEIESKTSRKIVSLRVPGTVDKQKSSSAPDVIRICQEPHPQRKTRKNFNGVGFVVVPESSDFDALGRRQSFEFQTTVLSSVPSIKRCSLDEIEAVKCLMEKNSKAATEEVRESRQTCIEVYKTPVGHSQAPRMGITT